MGRRLKRARDAAATGEHAGQRAPKAPRSAATAQDKPTANKALRAPQNGHHKRSRAVLDSDSDDDDGDACGERGAVVTAEARDGGNALETAKQAHGEGDAPTADEEARGGDQGTGVGKEPANAKEAPNSDVEIDSGDEEAEMLREAAGLDQGNGGGDDTTAMDLEDVWAEAEASEEAAATTLRDATAWLRHRLKVRWLSLVTRHARKVPSLLISTYHPSRGVTMFWEPICAIRSPQGVFRRRSTGVCSFEAPCVIPWAWVQLTLSCAHVAHPFGHCSRGAPRSMLGAC